MSDEVLVIRHTDKRSMVDLYAGLGGASEAMIRTGWDVLRIDNNPLLAGVDNMVMMDIKKLKPRIISSRVPESGNPIIDLVWASPPCRDFSLGFNAPKPTAQRTGLDYEPDMSLLEEAIRIIDKLKPRYWVIENVRGAIGDFEPYLGSPRLVIGAFVLWGNFPMFEMPENWHHSKCGPGSGDKHSSDPLRANYRAIIPFELSEQLRLAIEFQKRIDDY
jgi:hypothetical protein